MIDSARGISLKERRSHLATACLLIFALLILFLFTGRHPTPHYRYVLYSDLDGTLLHPHKDVQGFAHLQARSTTNSSTMPAADILYTDVATKQERECFTVPSSTSGPSYISVKTRNLVQQLRAHGVLFVIVTGGRKSTLLARLPFLPFADAYVSETGGRIMYNSKSYYLSPTGDHLQPSAIPTARHLVLDHDWAKTFEHITGSLESDAPPNARTGLLWDTYRHAVGIGLQPDAQSYWACFRIDLHRQQMNEKKAEELVRKVIEALPPEVSVTQNLGHYDFYPTVTGKGGVVRYLTAKFGLPVPATFAIFDDDNDLGMAAEVGQGFVVRMNTKSVEAAVQANPHWHVAHHKGVLATEEMLEAVLHEVTSH